MIQYKCLNEYQKVTFNQIDEILLRFRESFKIEILEALIFKYKNLKGGIK